MPPLTGIAQLTQQQSAASATGDGIHDISVFDSGVNEGRTRGTQPDAVARRIRPDRREVKRRAAQMRGALPAPGTEPGGLAVCCADALRATPRTRQDRRQSMQAENADGRIDRTGIIAAAERIRGTDRLPPPAQVAPARPERICGINEQ
ncbi:hypothetical protein ACFJIW_12745 [Tahibacter sp. UC22_41]|uniref:hypothetical protein n=1 Tax=Tahibacter sp. UC22_41 TaxID=3350178 RepID=UPI0036DA191F